MTEKNEALYLYQMISCFILFKHFLVKNNKKGIALKYTRYKPK